MSTMTRRGHRGAAAAVLIVGGGAVAAATWASGDRAMAVVVLVLYVVFSAIAFAWGGHSSDVGQLLRGGGDERQRALDRDATAITGAVLSATAVVWAIISLALDTGTNRESRRRRRLLRDRRNHLHLALVLLRRRR